MTIQRSNAFNPFVKSYFAIFFSLIVALNVAAQPCTPPNATFSFLPATPQCSGTPINFSVTTPQTNVVYSWNFGNGMSGSGANTTNRYDSIGNGTISYTVILTATDTSVASCSSSSSRIIQVRQRPSASIANPTATPFVNCPSGGITTFNLVLTNTSTTTATNTNYNIVWGDGTPNYNGATFPSPPNHLYTSIGFFNLVLTVTGSNGCSRTDTFPVFNGANPAVSLGTPGATVGLCTPYIITIPISGTSSNPPGTRYIITKNDGSRNDTLNHPPPANYVDTFFNTSCGATGGITPNTFFIRIRAVNPCGFSTSTIEPITTNQLPVARMSIAPDTIVCVNTVVTFTNTSIAGASVNNSGVCNSTTALNWVVTPALGWTINSGSLGTNPADPFNPTTWGTTPLRLSFNTPGIYQIKLRVQPTNICGYDSVIRTICVQGPPTPSFTPAPSTVCAPAPVTFTSTSTNLPVCGPLTYLWTVTKTSFTCAADSAADFTYISGTSSASINPVIRFNNQGIYSVTLSLTNRCGTFISPPQTITVRQRPRVTITATPSTICRGQSLTPSISTILDCGDPITSYNWTFTGGSPASSAVQVPGAVTYSAGGSYNITLAVQNLCGTTNVSTPVTVNDPPIVNAGLDQTVCLNSGAVTLSASPIGGTWSGTNTTAGGLHTPSTFGLFNLIYTASQNGCPASDTIQMTVNALPPMTVTPSSAICFGNNTVLTAGGANTYAWSPSGSLSAATGSTVTATPTGNTTYTVIGTNTTTNCTASITTTVTVNPLPVVNAGADQIVCNQPIPVNLTGSPAGGTWSGLNITSAGVFTPSGTGVFPVVYTFTNVNSCTNRDTVIMTVIDPTTPDAGLDRTVCQNSGAVSLTPTPPGGTWSGTNTSVAGVHTPSSVGSFNLIYTFGSSTCLRRDTLVMTVNSLPSVTISPAVAICIGDSTLLTAGGTDAYVWSPALGLDVTIGSTVIASPVNNTTYTVTGTDLATTCFLTRTVLVTVNPLPTVSAGVDRTFCNQPIPTNITGIPAGGSWSGPNITSGGSFTPNGLGTFEIVYTFTNANSCTNRDTALITVVNASVPNAGRDTAFCLNSGSRTLVGAPAGGTWSGTNINAAGVYNPITQGTFNLVYSFGSGTCLLRDTLVMTVNALPVLSVTPAPSICRGDSAVLTASGADSYVWSPATFLDVTTGPTVISKPTATTTYTITGTNSSTNCSASVNRVVTINELPVITLPANQALCEGDPTTLVTFNSSIGATTYEWYGSAVISITGYPASGTTVNIPSFTPSNADLFADDIDYIIVPTAVGCIGDTARYTFTVNPNPQINPIVSQSICSGGQTTVVSPSADITGATYNWSSATVSGITGNTLSGSGDIPTLTITNSSTAVRIVVYTVTPTFGGCPGNSTSYNITVNPAPNVNAIANQTICSGQATTVVNPASAVSGATYSWTSVAGPQITGNTPSGIGQIPAQVLVNSGLTNDTVTYSVSGFANGCNGPARIFRVIVRPTPIAVSTPLSDTICSGQDVSITLSSVVPGTTFSWVATAPAAVSGASSGIGSFISNVLTSNSNSPQSVVYAITPTANTCVGPVLNDTVTVKRSATVQFTPALAQTICNNTATQEVTISANTSGGTISWVSTVPPLVSGADNSGDTVILSQTLVNGSTTTQQVVYTASVVFQGCQGQSSTYTIDVNPTPLITNIDTARTICSGDSAQRFNFTSNVNGATYSWSTAGNPDLTGYAVSGTGNMPPRFITNTSTTDQTLVYSVTPTFAGCDGVVREFLITVQPRPTATLTPDSQSVCNNTTSIPIVITSNVSGTQFNWSSTSNVPGFAPLSGVGDTIPGILFQYPGIFSDTGYVQFTVVSSAVGCPGSTNISFIRVNPLPTIDFAMSQDFGCSPLTVNFTTNPFVFGNPDSLVFEWGDSTPNTVIFRNPLPPNWRNTSHSFDNSTTQAVSYYIKLTAYNNCGFTEAFDTVTVLPNLIEAALSASTTFGCEPLTVNFSNFSTGAINSSWCFNFDTVTNTCTSNAVVSNAPTIQHTFSAGNYIVALYISDGCSNDTAFVQVRVSPSPIPEFTFSPSVCDQDPVVFTDQSVIPTGLFLASSSWQYGDGVSAVGNNTVSHIYPSPGQYNACHVVALSNGCSDTICKIVEVFPKPQVDFVGYDTCLNSQPILFVNTSTGASSYIWYFGDGNASPLATPNHVYASQGTYTVTLIGSVGTCSDTAIHPYTLHPIPNSSFVVPNAFYCGLPQQLQLQNTSIGALFYNWDFGNGTTSSNNNPLVTYNAPGTYDIQLAASNVFGCSDTAIATVEVYPFPTIQSVDINPSFGCRPLTVTFTTNTLNGNSYVWNFGDGSAPATSSIPIITHVYSDTGRYTVSLAAYSFANCGDTAVLIDTIGVYLPPVADFDFVPNASYEPIDRTIVTLNNSQNATSYIWEFSDGGSSTDVSPVYTFPTPENYNVILIATNEYCSDTIAKETQLFRGSLFVPNAFAPDYAGNSDLVRVWQPVGIGLATYRAQVFNTWGELIWESTKLDNTRPVDFWDGTYRGNICPQDVYVWKVDAVFIDGARWEGMAYEKGAKKSTIGSITLVR
jgi:large repetitive protein